ncbi:MAG: hypothetical protein JO019_03900 [Candidatus Kaiserbacteria bacterium]|nr:hypothetical protein [Candidatus Kaiserbacteria bacterium]
MFAYAKNPIAIAIALIAIGILGGLLARRLHTEPEARLTVCFTTAQNGNVSADVECLRATVISLLSRESASAVMNYITASTSPAIVRTQCHEVAHVLGEELYLKTPTLEQALGACTTACSYGCIHGVVGAAVVKELGAATLDDEDIPHEDPKVIAEIGKKYCATGSALCHAIGHILYEKYSDYPDALKVCTEIGGTNQHRDGCYQGVFMESAGEKDSLLNKTPLAQIPGGDFAYPCDTIAPQYRNACFRYLPSFQRILYLASSTPPQARLVQSKQICETFGGKDSNTCIEFIGYYHLTTFAGAAPSNTFCDAFTDAAEHRACMTGIVLNHMDYFRYTSMPDYCATQTKDMTFCYDTAFAMLRAAFSIKTIQAQCDQSQHPDSCRTELAARSK